MAKEMPTEKNLILVRCLAIAGVLMIRVEAQTLPDSDGSVEDISWMMRSSTAAEDIQCLDKSDCERDQNMSSTQYPGGRFSSSLQAESDVFESAEWVWKPIQWDWWVILQMVAAVLGIVGNLLVVILLFQRRKSNRSTDVLIGALATADLSTSIFMIPLPFADRVPPTLLGQIYCKVVFSSFLMWVSVVASILTLTFIPFERYIVVVYPLRCKEFLSRKKILTVVILTWFLGILDKVIYIYLITIDPSSGQCIVLYTRRAMQPIIGVVTFVLEFLLQAILTLTVQILTARSLQRQSRLYLGADKQLHRSNPSVRHLIAKKRVLVMLAIVVLTFIICWGPTQTLYLALNLGLLPYSYLHSPLYRVLTVLAFCNSCANPIIYTVRYPEFRKAIKDILSPSRTAPLFEDRFEDNKSSSPPVSIVNVV